MSSTWTGSQEREGEDVFVPDCPDEIPEHDCEDHMVYHEAEHVEQHGLDCGPFEHWTDRWFECSVCGERDEVKA